MQLINGVIFFIHKKLKFSIKLDVPCDEENTWNMCE